MAKRILVIEDSESIRQVLLDALSADYEVSEAPDGLKGWLLATVEPLPDLIITDVEMPRLNGISLVKRLRANPLTKQIPIILLTSRSRKVDVIHGLKMGIRLYLTKPFHTDDLRMKVKSILSDGARGDAPDSVGTAPAP